jgi:hypothetical protein
MGLGECGNVMLRDLGKVMGCEFGEGPENTGQLGEILRAAAGVNFRGD